MESAETHVQTGTCLSQPSQALTVYPDNSIINEISGEIVEMMNIKLGTGIENVQDLKFSRHYEEDINFGKPHVYYITRDESNELNITEVDSWVSTGEPNDPSVIFNVSDMGFHIVSNETT